MAPNLDHVFSALEKFDNDTRKTRVERLHWLVQFQTGPTTVMGRPEPLGLLEEARVCYVNGHFMAVVLTAIACIEQMLMEELEYHNDRSAGGNFAAAIRAAKSNNSIRISTDLLDCADQLRAIRNPVAHKTHEANKNRLPNRVRAQKTHPNAILEADARLAVETMYGIFLNTLREIKL
jgi:hypothetical protein